ncbi:MAG TPA: class I SAM-dependent methyltransferase [Puia sp.]|jgi:predicted O-methyltransferase YrrM|nr:class I SAM-dependent methyltransferase [Puia sp.]
MYSRLRLAYNYLGYYLTAANGKGHGMHSPFVYDFVRNVLCDGTSYAAYTAIEELRKQLLKDEGVLEVEDMGAGSVRGEGVAGTGGSGRERPGGGARVRVRRVADIARYAAKPARLGQLLFRLANYYRPGVMVELGTSLGLSAAYLASGAAGAKIWTIEGSEAVAKRAAENLSGLGLTAAFAGASSGKGVKAFVAGKGVEVVTGNFDIVLAPLLEKVGPVDLAFVDGNHRYEPTLRYFDLLFRHSGPSAMLIFDDIHWSAEMEQAWAQIKADQRVMMTIDLFFFGLVVLRDDFKVKQDFTIRF